MFSGVCKRIPFEVNGNDLWRLDELFYNGKIGNFFGEPEKIETELKIKNDELEREQTKLSDDLQKQYNQITELEQHLRDLQDTLQKKRNTSTEMKWEIRKLKKQVCAEEARKVRKSLQSSVEKHTEAFEKKISVFFEELYEELSEPRPIKSFLTKFKEYESNEDILTLLREKERLNKSTYKGWGFSESGIGDGKKPLFS
jgi:polyhydroxyalkanoate synthesis regulator phasin